MSEIGGLPVVINTQVWFVCPDQLFFFLTENIEPKCFQIGCASSGSPQTSFVAWVTPKAFLQHLLCCFLFFSLPMIKCSFILFQCFCFGFVSSAAMNIQFSSVAQSCPTLCDPMNRSMPGLPVHHQLQEFTDSHPLSQWCHPTISYSVVPFSSCLQSFPASGSFQTSQFFTSGGHSIGVSASTSVLPVNIQD